MHPDKTVTVFTKRGSVLVITERGGEFTLVAEGLQNDKLKAYEGIPIAVRRPSPWIPKIAQEFMVYGEPGTPFGEGLFTTYVKSVEVLFNQRVESGL